MRKLFLDVDGVLNTDRSKSLFGNDHVNLDVVRSLADLCHGLTRRLGLGVHVVLSSTWRLNHRGLNATDLQSRIPFLALLPLSDDPMTPSLPDAARGDEVLAYLDRSAGVTGFAVLDDLTVQAILPANKPRACLVSAQTLLVDGKKGFGTPMHLESLANLLARPLDLAKPVRAAA